MDPDGAYNARIHDDHGALVKEGKDGDDFPIFDRVIVAEGRGVLGVGVGGCDIEG